MAQVVSAHEQANLPYRYLGGGQATQVLAEALRFMKRDMASLPFPLILSGITAHFSAHQVILRVYDLSNCDLGVQMAFDSWNSVRVFLWPIKPAVLPVLPVSGTEQSRDR